jgi:hypothetical protein
MRPPPLRAASNAIVTPASLRLWAGNASECGRVLDLSGGESFWWCRVCEEEEVERAWGVEVAEVGSGEAAKGGRVSGVVAGQFEGVAVGLTLPAP